ncbi:hypothetical protein Btru_025683 [Bulinus truncatus]|nr:hypothetical protein Btru_025683 [Bulinus truncatus]
MIQNRIEKKKMCYIKAGCNAALFVRSLHTLIVIGVPTSLLFKQSLLYHTLIDGEQLVLGVIYIAMMVWSLTMYYLTCFTNPGYIVVTKENKASMLQLQMRQCVSSDEENDLKDVKSAISNNADVNVDDSSDESGRMLAADTKTGLKYRVCDYCEIMQPMRAKHCEDCSKCVRKFDHHCPWLEACIGERNHRFFWLFLLSTFILITSTFYITWEAFEYRIFWSDWLEVNVILFVDLFILCIGGLVVMGLLVFHSYLMFKGLTTWEAASRERITYLKYLDEDYNPFNEGLCRNLYHFLFACHLRKWEKVYAGQAQGINGIV